VMDRRVPELVLIFLLAASCSVLAWFHQHQWAAAIFASAATGRAPRWSAVAAPEDAPWIRTLGYGHHRGRSSTHGYEPTGDRVPAALRALSVHPTRGAQHLFTAQSFGLPS
jgi:hypothetical protein